MRVRNYQFRFFLLFVSAVILFTGCGKIEKDENNSDPSFFTRMPEISTSGKNIVAVESEGQPYVFPYMDGNYTIGFPEANYYGLSVKTMSSGKKGEFILRVINLRYYEKYNPGSMQIRMVVPDSILNKGYGKIATFEVELNVYKDPVHKSEPNYLSYGFYEGDEDPDHTADFRLTKLDTVTKIVCGNFVIKEKEKDKKVMSGFFDLKNCRWWKL